ncbi:MAG: hypothetical protein IPI39_10285 [Candidatus Obscuribacter sp.]|jgi:hypothetical protein|nr:hypothetical protein [Candidatus Obscuribacter sp.]MBK9621434.1 hypothetical protein [Candidatus Obscuribacter sp.]
MINRLQKAAGSLAYLFLGYLSWKWFKGQLDFGFNLSCVILSLGWLLLTANGVGGLFRTYFDRLSRLKVQIPMTFGMFLSALVVFTPWDPSGTISHFSSLSGLLGHLTSPLPLAASLELLGWLAIYFAYKRNARKFKQQGHGPLPKGTWVNPPVAALQQGDLILTSGRIATRLRESVGHGEVVVDLGGPELFTFSSFMERGAVIQPLKEVADQKLERGHFVALRLVKPINARQAALIPGLVQIMLEQNKLYIGEATAHRQAIYSRLHLPAWLTQWIDAKIPVTGYDWFGLFTGRLALNRWTCVGACLELYHRLGIKTKDYGTGLFGLGTGVLDPIMPVRFLDDPALRLLTEQDRAEFERQSSSI